MEHFGALCACASREPVSIIFYCRPRDPMLIEFRVNDEDDEVRRNSARAIARAVKGVWISDGTAVRLFEIPAGFRCQLRPDGQAAFGLQCSRCRMTTERRTAH